MTWKEFQDGLDFLFGVTKFQDFFGDLIKLQQVGLVQDYQTQFEKLLAKVGYLPSNCQVSCFISDLKESIKVDVLAGCPATLSTTISLARLYEARNTSQHQLTITTDLRKKIFSLTGGEKQQHHYPNPTIITNRTAGTTCERLVLQL